MSDKASRLLVRVDLVPLVLNRFEIDPAVATGPFVTTSIDILGVACYFLIAIYLL